MIEEFLPVRRTLCDRCVWRLCSGRVSVCPFVRHVK